MNFDFSALLVLATFVSAVIILIDKKWFLEKRESRIREHESEYIKQLAKARSKTKVNVPEFKDVRKQYTPVLVDYSRSLFPVFFIVLLVRSFLFEPFQIPSGSMLPTLRIGDFILVNKFNYGMRLPIIGTKILPGNPPEAGDILVFRAPFDTGTHFIKRVVGTSGDIIDIRNNILYVNGNQVLQGMVQTDLIFEYPDYRIFNEKINDTNHLVLKSDNYITPNGSWTVPKDSFFVLGDNRGNSHDSRFWGFVPDHLVVGRAVYVWMHWDNFLSFPRFEHVGKVDKNL